MVAHTHASYPVGHLSTVYWIGLEPGDKHLNVASPGWAKHAWSNFFAPLIAEATIFLYNYARFDAYEVHLRMTQAGGLIAHDFNLFSERMTTLPVTEWITLFSKLASFQ